MLRAAAAAGAERVVHLSSGGVLERKRAGAATALLDETDFSRRPAPFLRL